MAKRIITGIVLVGVLIFCIAMGGWWFSIPFVALICLSEYEVFRALDSAGHRTVSWPVWIVTFVSLPIFTIGIGNIGWPLAFSALASMLISIVVILRKDPHIEDIWASITPMICVMIPALCMLGLLNIQDRYLQIFLLLYAFGIPLLGDTFALFIGMTLGKRKLCEQVSPNKTVAGCIGGLIGSILFALLVQFVLHLMGHMLIPWLHALLLGFVGGIAGQLGDLIASLIKRHCDIKDYGSIFPGHGGVTDRLDSVYFSTVLIYIYYVFLF